MAEAQIAMIHAEATLTNHKSFGEDGDKWNVHKEDTCEFTYTDDIRAGDRPVYKVAKDMVWGRQNPVQFIRDNLPEQFSEWHVEHNSVEVTAVPSNQTMCLAMAVVEAWKTNEPVDHMLLDYVQSDSKTAMLGANGLIKLMMKNGHDLEPQTFHNDEDLFEALESLEGFDPQTEFAVEE